MLPLTSLAPGLGLGDSNNATEEDMIVDDMEVQKNNNPTRTIKTVTNTVTDLHTNKKTTKMTKLTVKEPQAKKGTGKRKRGANEEVARKRKRVVR